MSFALYEVPAPGDGPPHPLLSALAAVDGRVWFELFGHDDFGEDHTSWAVSLTATPYHAGRAWVALPPGVRPDACAPSDALGHASLDLSLTEDTSTAQFMVGVVEAARGRGIGSALYERVLAGIGDRTTLQTWFYSPEVPAGDVRAVLAASGSGAVDGASPGASWLLHRGFVLEQAERYSRLDVVAGSGADLAVLAHSAAQHAGVDYDLVSWHGRVPDVLVDDLAELQQRFSVDAPTAGLDVDEQVWDADRVAVTEDRGEARGHDRVRVAVRHVPSGRLVALTELTWASRNPAGVWQQITLVHPRHRGHRLGLWMKAANLQQLLAVNPDAARVHTWNANENSHMLAINEALGFQRLGLEGGWQKRLQGQGQVRQPITWPRP